MRINKILFVLLVFLIMGGLSGCSSSPSVLTQTTSVKGINLELGTTIGNHTYLPINIGGDPSGHVQEILQIVDAFESAHPEWEVTSWSIESKYAGYGVRAYIYGIWINHRSREE
ncbi:MAG: hypothetical protein COX90_03895 [Candidatus Nealsonbacteria bacterium CG_4_10_14_0_2_um_filter_38_17]|uniref:Uncharacterized protein n=2 Tax=Candidatus Nealsoniibacteriota TaxID=1817911 RepID=A0A2M7UXA7_9BACT|nr:MAG: hypothetical protein COX36_00675 [Candidatus Nealsonbacteria bacterium CG23_combo_of_CG06-09_8_20_14_all_38_19]PIZ88590.1 MAG: hypothetical protein COX90_03895 [Candidatus Nealsonbacteria bacterium CG_4_10_14_0_2_um_filter_38_17]